MAIDFLIRLNGLPEMIRNEDKIFFEWPNSGAASETMIDSHSGLAHKEL
jgi:hypothetical protein